jgi:hypothetical protein
LIYVQVICSSKGLLSLSHARRHLTHAGLTADRWGEPALLRRLKEAHVAYAALTHAGLTHAGLTHAGLTHPLLRLLMRLLLHIPRHLRGQGLLAQDFILCAARGTTSLTKAEHSGLRSHSLIHHLAKAAQLTADLRSKARDAAARNATGLAHAAQLTALLILRLSAAHLSKSPKI